MKMLAAWRIALGLLASWFLKVGFARVRSAATADAGRGEPDAKYVTIKKKMILQF